MKESSIVTLSRELLHILYFSCCPAGDWTWASARSRWCTTTWQLWAIQTLYECSRKQPTQTSAVWFVSTVVSTNPQGPSFPPFTICCCLVGSGRSPVLFSGKGHEGLKTDCSRPNVPKRFSSHPVLILCLFVCMKDCLWIFSLDLVKKCIFLSLPENNITNVQNSW